MAKIKNNDSNAGKDAEKLDCLHVAGENANETAIVKRALSKENVIVIQPRNCTLGIFPQRNEVPV